MPLPETASMHVPMPPSDWAGSSVRLDTTVEVRWWQPEATSGVDHRALEVLDRVMRQAVPHQLLPSREAVEVAAATPDPEDFDTYQTVVELRARVPVLTESSILSAFERAVEALQHVDRATRILMRAQTAPLTLERLHQIVPFATLGDNGVWDARSGWVIAHRRLPYEVAPEQLELPSVEHVRVQMDAVRRGHPMALYWDRMLPAYAAYDAGDFDAAVLNAAIATEVLIDSVLALAHWDDGSSPRDTAHVLARPIVKKVRTELRRIFGDQPSTWSPDEDGVVGRWRADLVHLRNAIVHRGYAASQPHAYAAIEAAERFRGFTTDRVLAHTQIRPRGTLILIGPAGIQRGEQWSAAVEAVSHLDWLDRFNCWRDQVDEEAEQRRRPRPTGRAFGPQ